MYGCRRLRVSKFFEYKWYFCFVCVEKECSKFSFSGLCCNEFENGASDMDCTIDEYWLRVSQNTTKEEVISSMTSCLEGTEVGGIRVYVDDHVGSSMSDFCIGVHPHVVEELVQTHEGFFSWGTLLCGNSR